MKICFLDNVDFSYTSKDLYSNKLRGAESVLINLSIVLKNMGHNVTIFNNNSNDQVINGINWINLSKCKEDVVYDLAISNNDIKLFDKVTAIKKIAFSHSIQSIEKFIRKGQLLSYFKHKPKIVILSNYHKKNRNFFLKMFGTIRIDWSVDDVFLKANLINNFESNYALFTSRPDRNLDLLVDIWQKYIHPKNNKLKLLITPKKNISEINGIVHRSFGSQNDLIKDLLNAKILLVPGHKGELYCLAAEEARELCLPIVTLGIGSLSERVIHGKTGFIANNPMEFAKYALELFENQSLWLTFRNNLLKLRGSNNWEKVASKIISNI